MGSRPCSTRRHAWHLQPLSAITGDPVYTSTGSRQTIMCGYLFNADAERSAQGFRVGEGEECCITLEPIADARLAFCDTIRVSSLHPTLTGVELLCGHRFSATNLLWHWCMSSMVCPMCRATYSLHGRYVNGVSGSQETPTPVSCAVDNFPARYWRLLRGIIGEHTRERDIVLEQENRDAAVSAAMITEFENTLTPVSDFYLMLSFVGIHSQSTHHSVLLHPSTTIDTVPGDSPYRFHVDRASTRYISRLINIANHASRRSGQPCRMTVTILGVVGTNTDSHAVVLPLTIFDDHVLPMIPPENGVVVILETIDTVSDTVDPVSDAVDPVPDDSPSRDAPTATPDSSSSLPGQPDAYMASIESASAIRFGFFHDTMDAINTLVSITVSLQSYSTTIVVGDSMV
jgi:hypothetical protein